MNDFKHVLGLLSRDMLLSRGHFLTIRNLDGGAQRDRRSPTPQTRSSQRDATPNVACPPGTPCSR